MLSVTGQAKLFGKFAVRLRPFLRSQIGAEQARRLCEEGLAQREDRFLRVVERGVYPDPANPYRRLLDHAGIALEDLQRMVRTDGLEPTLEALFDAGVYASLDEFKGRVPVRRGSLEFAVTSHDFDNPLASEDFSSRTGGSRSAGTRLIVDLDLLAHDAAYVHHQLAAFGLLGRPTFVWCSTPPYVSGISEILRLAKLGITPRKWFAQSVARLDPRSWRQAMVTHTALAACRAAGLPVPGPIETPLANARVVAEALAAVKANGEQPVLRANGSSAVRVCAAALADGIDISGTVMRVSAEPFTPAKAEMLARAGCTAAPWYAASETGIIGLPCADPAAVDDVHFMADKLALVRRDKTLRGGQRVSVNVYTTLVASTPKLMLNVMSDDYAEVTGRRCRCPLGALGYHTHFNNIRSYEKLTSEGMTFLGHDLIRLVEEVLPARFGGGPTDYQFVEIERDGLPRVDLLVSPRLGPLDERAVIAATLDFLDHIPGAQIDFGDRWRQGETLTVRREEPIATAASKVLALHVTKPIESN